MTIVFFAKTSFFGIIKTMTVFTIILAHFTSMSLLFLLVRRLNIFYQTNLESFLTVNCIKALITFVFLRLIRRAVLINLASIQLACSNERKTVMMLLKITINLNMVYKYIKNPSPKSPKLKKTTLKQATHSQKRKCYLFFKCISHQEIFATKKILSDSFQIIPEECVFDAKVIMSDSFFDIISAKTICFNVGKQDQIKHYICDDTLMH